MEAIRTELRRRNTLLAALWAAGAGLIAGGLVRPAAAQEKATLLAKHVDRVPDAPDASAWRDADMLIVPLAPQVVAKPRVYDAAVKRIELRALYDDRQIAFLLSWQDASQDSMIGGVERFRDAVAIEFPSDPASGIPYFAMGEANKPVTIYQWKADWQFSKNDDEDRLHPNAAVDLYPFSGRAPGEPVTGPDYGRQGADKAFHTSWSAGNLLADPDLHSRTAVEKLVAHGFGSLTSLAPDRQDGGAKAAWSDGRWQVALVLPRAQDGFTFESGQTLPIALAAWDGGKGERGGEKAVSTWYFLSLEKPMGTVAYVSPVLAVVGAVAVQAWGLRRFRRRAGTAVASKE